MVRAMSRAQLAVIATAAAFGVTYGLTAPLIALELNARGVSPVLIGLNAAMHAIGVLLIAPCLPSIVGRAGLKRPATVALAVSAVVLCAFPLAPALWVWFLLRVLLGMSSESLFVISESWLSDSAENASRARTMGTYVAAMSGGIALGPAVLAVAGRDGAMPFVIGAGLALLALSFLVVLQPREPVTAAMERAPFFSYLKLAPLAIAAAALNASVEAAGLSLLPLYAIQLGWTEARGTLLLTTLLVGAIVLQLPIGWLGDRFNRDRLISLLAWAAGVGALLWPLSMQHAWIAWPLLFVWGGAFVGIYTLVLTVVGERFTGPQLAGVFALMSVAWGLGALIGPALGGMAMHIGQHGLAVMVAVFCFVFGLCSLALSWRKSHRG